MRLPTKGDVIVGSLEALGLSGSFGIGWVASAFPLDTPASWAIVGGVGATYTFAAVKGINRLRHRKTSNLWPYATATKSFTEDDNIPTIVPAPSRPGPPKNPPRPIGVQVIDGPLSPIDRYYYLDQDISAGALLHLLRKHKFNVLSTYEADRASSEDEPQLRFSARNRRRIITCDSGFLSLDAQGVPHAGIIHVPNNGSEWYPEILRVCLQLAEEAVKA